MHELIVPCDADGAQKPPRIAHDVLEAGRSSRDSQHGKAEYNAFLFWKLIYHGGRRDNKRSASNAFQTAIYHELVAHSSEETGFREEARESHIRSPWSRGAMFRRENIGQGTVLPPGPHFSTLN